MEVVREFVDELISLGILQRASREEVVTTTPLFVVPKPGQEGQWRVIADMLRGGQNAASANNPVFLNRPLYILHPVSIIYIHGWTERPGEDIHLTGYPSRRNRVQTSVFRIPG